MSSKPRRGTVRWSHQRPASSSSSSSASSATHALLLTSLTVFLSNLLSTASGNPLHPFTSSCEYKHTFLSCSLLRPKLRAHYALPREPNRANSPPSFQNVIHHLGTPTRKLAHCLPFGWCALAPICGPMVGNPNDLFREGQSPTK